MGSFRPISRAGRKIRIATKISYLHVIAGLDEAHGGPTYCVPRLCTALANAGAQTTLFSVATSEANSRNAPAALRYAEREFAWDYSGVPVLRALRKSFGLKTALRHAAPVADVIHNHGVWLLPNIVAGWEARRAHKPFIVSPHGMLSPAALGFSRWKKRAFWSLAQGQVLRDAACLHATSDQEYQELRDLGLENPIAIIPNGIDLPDFQAGQCALGETEKTILSLGRIHPKKGLDRLLRAWTLVEAVNPTWRLRIAGPSEDQHAGELQALAATLGLRRVAIEGPIYGDAKIKAYRDASLFVLPTRNENFGLTVAEALAAGTPVISTKGAPWRGLVTEGCGWWIDDDVDAVASALRGAMATPTEILDRMGEKGRAWMARDYSWDRVARAMNEVYGWLAPGMAPDVAPPATVRFR